MPATILNVDTVIPTASRIAVRNAIVTANGFDAWRVANTGDTKTRKLSKAQWFDAAHALGVVDRVLDLINNPPEAPEAEAPAGDETVMEETAAPAPVAGPVNADSVLDIVRPFLGVALVDQIGAALAPIVDRANRPDTVQTVETVVYQQLAPGQAAPVIPFAKPGEVSTMGKAFGLRGRFANGPATFWDATEAMGKPKPIPAYVQDNALVWKFATALERSKFVWMAGPASSGKTTLPQHVASVLHRPFVRIAFNRQVEATDLVGMLGLDGAGGMAWRDGVLTQAIRRPGTVILLDEPTFAPPGVAAILQTLLDDRRLTIAATGEVVTCAAGVYFCAADNTRGYGDETGRYAGTMQANTALIDRFAYMYVVDYMSADKEAEALVNHNPGVSRDACQTVAEFVKLARGLPGFEDIPLGLRRMSAFVDACRSGQTTKEAFADSFLTRLVDSEREALNGAFRTHFPDGLFEAQLNGSPAPAPVSNDPAQTSARSAFDPIDD